MNYTDTIGTLGATLTTVAFMPQVWQTFRTKDVSGISLGMYTVLTIGISLWVIYGWLIVAWPVVIANGVTLSLALAILVMKLRYQSLDSQRP
jgi:MtN3 and saliva related transmembrane protein